MTYCKNCHKMSKDDDFCSHCGSAVWGEDYVSNDAAICCDSLEGHTHDKVTYKTSERGEGVHIPEGYKPYNPTNQRPKRPNIQDNDESLKNAAKQAKKVSTIIKIIFLIIFASAFFNTFIGFFKHF